MLEQLVAEARERARTICCPRLSVDGRGFSQALLDRSREGGLAVIAEVKPRSPTTFNADISPSEAAEWAREYQRLGAVAVSVLTEPRHFGGSIEHLLAVREAVDIPVLRKDFIVKEVQMDEVECDAVLLIARALGPRLSEMVDAALDRGMETLVEVHAERELHAALKTRTPVVGVNNRDLQTLDVDTETALRLLPVARDSGRVLVAESGISDAGLASLSLDAGADAVLMGNALMQNPGLIAELMEVER